MTYDELVKFLDENPVIEWKEGVDKDHLYLRHSEYDSQEEGISLDLTKLESITPPQLLNALVCGRNVEQLTRITGYFSRVSGWNKGKIGELKDRARVVI